MPTTSIPRTSAMVYYYQPLDGASEKAGQHSSRRLQILCTLLAILNLCFLLRGVVHPGGESPTREPYIYCELLFHR
jgi:hypothetical protein